MLRWSSRVSASEQDRAHAARSCFARLWQVDLLHLAGVLNFVDRKRRVATAVPKLARRNEHKEWPANLVRVFGSAKQC